MSQEKIKILTFIGALIFSVDLFAASFSQEEVSTHLRWNVHTDRNSLMIERDGNSVVMKSLNPAVISNLSEAIDDYATTDRYIESIETIQDLETSVNQLVVTLKDSDVEVFSFYVDRERKYVLDFWSSTEESVTPRSNDDQVLSFEQQPKGPLTPPVGRVNQELLEQQRRSRAQVETTQEEAPVEAVEVPEPTPKNQIDRAQRKRESRHRDYRYGASFIWNYAPLAPKLTERVNLERKTPEYFYEIEDRDYEKNEMEAHLQLSINLYRKRNFGLMYKSIRLFEEKYGQGQAFEVIEYLKANALLRDSLNQGEREPVKTAMSMLSTLAAKTDNYEMQKGIYNYLISSSIKNKDHVKALDYSKRLYVNSRENFDYEESELAAESILYNLAKLNQIEDIRELTNDETVKQMIPAQVTMAYKLYALMKLDRHEEVVREYEKVKNSLSRPIHPSILFNVAEAYFRVADYDTSIDLFDQFVASHSHKEKASNARLRIAQAYEISGKEFDQVRELYRNAINRSTKREVTSEARIRYVGVTNLRKKDLNESDKELRVLLDFSSSRSEEESQLSSENSKLLWLVRLRTFIVDQKYQEALSYLKALPLNRLSPVQRRVFHADAAEIVYGMMLENFRESNYGQVVKIWELYKNEYVDKVARDPFVNFIVGSSFVRLGLYNRFDHIISQFEEFKDHPSHSFPLWVEREQLYSSEALLEELKLVKNLNLENYELVEQNIEKLRTMDVQNKDLYYEGILAYRQEDYQRSARALEEYLSRQSTQSVYDPNDVAEMLLAYSDSVYQSASKDRFKKVAEAVLKDVENFAPEHDYMNNIRERISYLYIETLASDIEQNSLLLEPRILSFLEDYPESSYSGRVRYLLGMAFVNNNKQGEGIEVFETLLDDQNISEHIREMARSEMALLNIRNRNL